MLLLPSTRNASFSQASSQNNLQAFSRDNPTSSRPNFLTGQVNLTLPAFIPVNADDDNGSDVTDGIGSDTIGIPEKRDFNVSPIVGKDDPELLAGTLQGVGLPPGSWSITVGTHGLGQVKLWADKRKQAPFAPTGQGTFTFYAEGVHESSSLNDVFITAQWIPTPPNFGNWGMSVTTTVTPLINSFTITPAGPAGTQNINFINGVDATAGIKAAVLPLPPGPPGAKFDASLTYTSLTGNPVFVQDFWDIINGYNGMTGPNGQPIGYLYSAGSNPAGANLGLALPATFPILDLPAGGQVPEYTLENQQHNGNIYTISSSDSPTTGLNTNVNNVPAPGPQAGIGIDIYYNLFLWLLWKYPATTDGSGNPVPPVYYPLAYARWGVEWVANAQNPNGPVNHITIPQGISADTYSRTNGPPSKMASPIFRDKVAWSTP